MNTTHSSWLARKKSLGEQLVRSLYENRLFRTWLRDRPEGWELISGVWSPFYLQVRHVASYPALLTLVGTALAELIRNEAPEVNRLIGIASAGVPLATAAGLNLGLPVGYTRKIPGVRTAADLEGAVGKDQEYGEHAQVEGVLAAEDQIALVDDVAAKFSSKEVAIKQLEMEARRRGLSGITPTAVVVLIDREQGAAEAAQAAGVRLLSAARLRSEGLAFLEGVALPRELEVLKDYLRDPQSYQSGARRAELEREARG